MKKKVGLTMRIDRVKEYKETRDSIDQRWGALFEKADIIPVYFPAALSRAATACEIFAEHQPHGLVLSGGNDIGEFPERDAWEEALVEEAIHREVPVLGVCRGAQVLGKLHGSELEVVEGHVRTRHYLETSSDRYANLSGREVNSFHAYGFRTLSKCLEVVATARDGTVEMFRHRALPHVGVFWHPEREDPFHWADIEFLRGFF